MNSRPKPIFVICTGTVALALLMAFSAPRIGRESAPVPDVRYVPKGQTLSAITQVGRALPPAEPKPTPVYEETANVEPHNTVLTEIDFEPPKPSGSPAISTPKEAPRDKPPASPTSSQNTASITATEPKMGDTRIMDGQQQVYFLGFGWIEDSNEPNVGIVVDGEGDINKMIGTMG